MKRILFRGALGTSRSLSTKSNISRPRTRLWPKLLAGVFVAGGVGYYTNDTFHDATRHSVLVAKRVSVVAVATAKCFWIYKDVLGRAFDDEHERNLALSKSHEKAAKITLKALEKNGGIYIKLGQHVSALTYLLPKEWTDTMVPLQDRCPRSSMEEIERMFHDDMEMELGEYFSEFDEHPVGVASLAQVHVATVRSTGERVAVKVQHPSLSEFVPLDVYLTLVVFRAMYLIFPEYPMTWLSDELQNSIFVELDFTNEAINAQNTTSQFKNLIEVTALRVPKIVHSTKRILVMEHVSGARLDDLQFMKEHKIDPAEVSSCLSHIFNNMIFTENVGLHCDPHGGNLAIRSIDRKTSCNGHNFEIVLYDHGLYRYIPLQLKRDYAHFWLALLDNDVPKLRDYAERIAGITGDRKFRIFIGAITGRNPDTALNEDIKSARGAKEMEAMQEQLYSEEGVLEDLMEILSSMPRIILLILKTNDLTRNLDENLNSPLGPERTFLILANYSARTVYEEGVEITNALYSKFSWNWVKMRALGWFSYQKRLGSLRFYDFVMMFRHFIQV